jgi:hypothetical protein
MKLNVLFEGWEDLGIEDPFSQSSKPKWKILYQIKLKSSQETIQNFDDFEGSKEEAQRAADYGMLKRFKKLGIDLEQGWELDSGYDGWLNPEVVIGDTPFANYWSLNQNYEEEAYSRGYGHNSDAVYAIAYIFSI